MEKTTEENINKFIEENINLEKNKPIKAMTIQEKMAFVGMKNQNKWDEFKLGLRKDGYII